MASLKDLRNRIASVAATQKITRALQMVAAAKLRRSREAAENARPYAERMAGVIANLAAGVSGAGAPELLVGTGSDAKELVVVATFDRGLAGGFNSSIIRAAREHIAQQIAARANRLRYHHVWSRQARRSVGTPSSRRSDPSRSSGGRRPSRPAPPPKTVAAERRHWLRFEAIGEADVVTLFFNRFASVVSQVPTRRRLVPAEVEAG